MKLSTEVRLLSAVHGAISLIAACVIYHPLSPMQEWFDRVPDIFQLWMAAFLAVTAVMQIVGARIPCRALRHWGLILNAIGWLAFFVFCLSVNLVSIASLITGIVAFVAALLYGLDVNLKPRSCSVPRR